MVSLPCQVGEHGGQALSQAASDEAPHLARDGGELNRTVGRMMVARTVRIGLSPITRRRTLAELRVRLLAASIHSVTGEVRPVCE